MHNKNIEEIVSIFINQQAFNGAKKKSQNATRSALSNIMRLISKRIFDWNAKDCLDVFSRIYLLPKNITQKRELHGLNGKKLLKKADLLRLDRISIATAEKYVRTIKNFFKWLHSLGIVKHNYFKELKPKKSEVKDSEQRIPYDEKQINEIIKSEIFKDNNNYFRWIVLIAIEMGMRQNEIAQLYRSDVINIDGVWCISVSGIREDQRLKNKNASRIIPIPKTLIDLGLMKYVASCNERLFPYLKYYEIDGYSRNVSKWFSKYKKQWEFGNDRDFHSFRHYFINKLKQSNIEEYIAAQIVGHGYEKETYGRYGKAMSVKKIKKTLDKSSSKSVKKMAFNYRLKNLFKFI